MKTLMLMRHAKAVEDGRAARDFDRGLAPRGVRAAPLVGAALVARGYRPDLVVCSPARRTRETLDGVLSHLPAGVAVAFEQRLYLATGETVLQVARELPDEVATALIIGHNPGTHELAVGLAGSSESDKALAALHKGFPTAALAALTFEVARWDDVARCGGLLAWLVTPRDL